MDIRINEMKAIVSANVGISEMQFIQSLTQF